MAKYKSSLPHELSWKRQSLFSKEAAKDLC